MGPGLGEVMRSRVEGLQEWPVSQWSSGESLKISKSQPNQAGKLEAESLNILPQKESLLHYLGSAVPRQGLTWALWALISH